MKITSKILSLPPYLSTSWKNIASLSVEDDVLIVVLQNGARTEIAGLDKESIRQIFEAHARFDETEDLFNSPYSLSLPLKPDGSLEVIHSSLQHNPDQMNLPPLPHEVLKKIAAVARAFGLEDTSLLSPAHLNCNCMYCQITRTLAEKVELIEEEVSAEELTFRNWDIAEIAEKLYLVTNPLDKNEHYNVFLGEPLGCTCGHKNCEHLRAVLST